MSPSRNASAWALACQIFGRDGPTIASVLSDASHDALALLVDLKFIKPHTLDRQFVLCPYCQLLRGRVVQGTHGLICECADCGAVPMDKLDTQAWTFETDWLIRKLRGALDVPAQQGTVSVSSGIWRLGTYQHHPLILARSLDLALRQPTAVSRANSRTTHPPWLITPKPLRDVDGDPFGGEIVWLPMEERFGLYGGKIHFIEPGTLLESDDDGMQAMNGPFTSDFRRVHLTEWPHGPILLSDAQVAIFKSLWHFKGVPQSAERIMGKAGYKSDKPADLFKVKKQNKGDLKYEGQHYAYQKLVDTNRRAGTYALPCAASTTG